ncbi:hypothetical protein EMIT036CA2_40373 [Chryseobacterium sp. IT-36CA2]
MSRFKQRNGSSIMAPFRSLFKSWKQIINKMPAAIRKFPQTNVFGNKIITEANIVRAPLIISPVLSKPHFPNISVISALPEIIAIPCLKPIKTANKINAELIIFRIIDVFFYIINTNINEINEIAMVKFSELF